MKLNSQPGCGPKAYNLAPVKSSTGGGSVADGVIVGVSVGSGEGDGELVCVRVGLGGRIVGYRVAVAVGS